MKLHELDEPKWDYVMWCVKKQNVGRKVFGAFSWGESRVDFSIISSGVNFFGIWAATGDV